jgi:cytochrome bd-type quinol oxidase subunit 2
MVLIPILLLFFVAIVSGGSMRRKGRIDGRQYAALLVSFAVLTAVVIVLRVRDGH